MQQTIHALYDGKVFTPEEKITFPPNARYLLQVQQISVEEHPLTKIKNLAEDFGIADLAENHDRYAHGKLE
ncbi:MAG: hypothetical protein AAB071_04030 [Bacteroidota bacterium]